MTLERIRRTRVTERLTETQQKMLATLSDGGPHTVEELHACLSDDLGALSNIRAHLTGLRKLLRPIGQDIICQRGDNGTCYRHVRLVAPSSAENQ